MEETGTKRSSTDTEGSNLLDSPSVVDNNTVGNTTRQSIDNRNINFSSLSTTDNHNSNGRSQNDEKKEDFLVASVYSEIKQDKRELKDVVVEIEMHSVLPKISPSEEDDWSDSDVDDDDDDAVEVDKVRLGNIVSKVIIQSRRLCSVGLGYVVERTNGYLTRIVLLIGYIVYLVASLIYRFDDEGSHRLLGFTLLGAVIMTRRTTISACRWVFRKVTGIEKPSPRLQGRLETVRYFTRWLMYGGVTGVMAWILIDKAITEPRNLSSVPGLIIIVLVCLMFSTKPDKINYHTVYWGLGLQFIFSLLVLKWEFGKNAIVWLQSRLDEFFENSVVGSKFLFGDDFADHYIMFGALPLLFFTNGVLTLLYYLGAMQLLIKVIGNFLTFVLETSGIESMAVAAGIFMEGVTSLTAFRPYLVTLSKSQMFLVITSCFSSIGGAYLAVLSKMGVSVEFIIGAMLVSAPATFTVCKLMVPETKDLTKGGRDEAVSKIGDEEKGKYSNGLDAMQTGALNMLSVVGNIAVSAFTLICFIEWINQTLIWFGDRIGENGLSMEFIASYILFPISVAMGVELQDCRRVAMLNGYRVASSNIVAFFKYLCLALVAQCWYEECIYNLYFILYWNCWMFEDWGNLLTEMRENRMIFEDYMLKTNGTGNVTYVNDDIILNDWSKTLHLGFISLRSEAITTYFLCGFSSFLSVAIHLGMMSAYVPNRKKWLTKMAPAAFVAGNLANIMTGCFACIFY